MGRVSFNFDAFARGLGLAANHTLAAAVLGLERFAEHVVGEAQQKCPVDTGALQGSGTKGRTASQVAADVPTAVLSGKIEKEIGFNVNYAAAVHERMDVPHELGGPKFLENAIAEQSPKFERYVGSVIRKVMGT